MKRTSAALVAIPTAALLATGGVAFAATHDQSHPVRTTTTVQVYPAHTPAAHPGHGSVSTSTTQRPATRISTPAAAHAVKHATHHATSTRVVPTPSGQPRAGQPRPAATARATHHDDGYMAQHATSPRSTVTTGHHAEGMYPSGHHADGMYTSGHHADGMHDASGHQGR